MIDIIGTYPIELPLVFMGGILGSSHCVGMCGGFAVAVGYSARSFSANLIRQVLWSLGRIFTYAFLGTVAGFLGSRMSLGISLTTAQGLLALVAGLLLISQGLFSAGILRWPKRRFGKCPIDNVSWLLPIGRMMRPPRNGQTSATRAAETFLAGVVTGFLPCGLVYAYLALAAASANMWWGLTIMVAFGFGTTPIMIATGAGASLLTNPMRVRLFRIAAWCILLTGVLTIGRGFAALGSDSLQGSPACPMCEEVVSIPPTVQ